MKPTVTVFTPTYNRAYCLSKCYESLLRQSSKDFLWMVIDDGSTDNTKELVSEWTGRDNGFEIQYIYKENGGLHTGYNTAIANADTELMVCVDSDDYLTDDAIEVIVRTWRERGSEKFAGIVALDRYENGEIIGDPLPDLEHINLIDLWINKYKIRSGDRKNVVRTEVYKGVAPMPVFEGERNFNPHYMHMQISEKYDFLVLNQPLCVVEYQPDGMTNNIFHQYYDSPKSFAEGRKQAMCFPGAKFPFVFKQCIHYVSSSIFSRNKHFISESPKKFLTVVAIPFGVLLTGYVKYKIRS